MCPPERSARVVVVVVVVVDPIGRINEKYAAHRIELTHSLICQLNDDYMGCAHQTDAGWMGEHIAIAVAIVVVVVVVFAHICAKCAGEPETISACKCFVCDRKLHVYYAVSYVCCANCDTTRARPTTIKLFVMCAV